MYIVGSDQVWNIGHEQENNLRAHFLNFGNDTIKRVSYAASFGFSIKELGAEYAKTVFPFLKKFAGISVREENGIAICERIAELNNSYLKVVQVCDPTMLLSGEEYLKIFNREDTVIPSDPYVFVYNINASSDINIHSIQKWAKKRKLKLVYVMGHGKTSKIPHIYPTVPQWIKLIANAEFVITNSFHGSVFSLLFHKKCAVYPVNLKTPTNSRLETLVSLTEKSFIVNRNENFEDKLSINIDWDLFEKNKDRLRQSGVSFLSEALNH